MVPEVSRAQVLAQEINTIKEYTKRQVLSASIEIGHKLCEAKALVQHGEWEAWLETNVSYSQSTANNLMRIAKEYGTEQILWSGKTTSEIFGNLTYTQAVVLLGLPMEERVEVVETQNVEQMSTRELEEAVAARKKAEEQVESMKNDVSQLKAKAQDLKKRADDAERLQGIVTKRDEEIRQMKMQESEKLNREKAKYQALEKKLDEAEQKAKQSDEKIADAVKTATEQVRAQMSDAVLQAQKQAEELQKKLEKAGSSGVQKFAIYLEQFKADFEKLCDTADEVGDEDEQEAQKLYAGIGKVLHMMLSGIEEG